VAAGLGWALWTLPERRVDLAAEVAQRLDPQGVTNPVTAVLLDFRAYDTLLEIAVMVVAVAAVWALIPRSPGRRPLLWREGEEPVLGALVRLVAPLALLTAAYLVWSGARAPGGAFQAGALLAGGGVLVLAAGHGELPPPTRGWLRALLASGLWLFAGIGAATLSLGGAFLDYPDGAAYPLILAIEGAIVLSTALVLVSLFAELASGGGEAR
jgi:multisubunit Na+/H+ antiporter MnhB subunit